VTSSAYQNICYSFFASGVAGSSAGDPYYSLSVAGAINMSFGLKNSDADNFYLNTGVGLAGTNLLKITHAGAVTMPLQPSFYAYNANAILNQFGDGTTYQVVYDTETYDTNSDYDHTTGAFTAPVTGTYIFNAKLAITTLTTAWTTCQFQINTNAGASGMPLWYGNPGVVQQGGLLQISGVRHVKLTAADTAYVTIRIANSAKTLDISANSWFSGSLLN